ncbi:Cerato-platanin [Paxillus ammoniavirescens]|nr:Cerato-platanin [Paxillus ammoniavirescens]
MKFFAIAALATFAAPALAYTVSYDTTYDQGSTSLDEVACSNGSNGLETDGYTTFNSIPNFPYIGGAPQITGWNSASCGTCWTLTYTNTKGVATSINVTAIDVGDAAFEGFNISLEAMNVLTNNQAEQLGRVPVTAAQAPASSCGL